MHTHITLFQLYTKKTVLLPHNNTALRFIFYLLLPELLKLFGHFLEKVSDLEVLRTNCLTAATLYAGASW